QSLCERRGCCWSPHGDVGAPWCFFSSQHGYEATAVSSTAAGLAVTLRRLPAPSLFGADTATVQLQAQFQTPNRLRLQFTDPGAKRFEVPHEHVGPFEGSAAADPEYELQV
ncbi:SUIS protein, partial [Piprites chloris]|nr:SUIS protein [Piprites chloris]